MFNFIILGIQNTLILNTENIERIFGYKNISIFWQKARTPILQNYKNTAISGRKIYKNCDTEKRKHDKKKVNKLFQHIKLPF